MFHLRRGAAECAGGAAAFLPTTRGITRRAFAVSRLALRAIGTSHSGTSFPTEEASREASDSRTFRSRFVSKLDVPGSRGEFLGSFPYLPFPRSPSPGPINPRLTSEAGLHLSRISRKVPAGCLEIVIVTDTVDSPSVNIDSVDPVPISLTGTNRSRAREEVATEYPRYHSCFFFFFFKRQCSPEKNEYFSSLSFSFF